MSTQEPTQNSLPEDSKIELTRVHDELKQRNINPDNLGVFIMGQNELVFGEIYNPEDYQTPEEPGKLTSIFETSEFVAVKNPKRLVRLTAPVPGGGINFHLIFADFDMIEEGVIELRPQGCFFLQWLDEAGQLRYCKSYLNWLDGKLKARAQASGLHLPDGTTNLEAFKRLGERLKG